MWSESKIDLILRFLARATGCARADVKSLPNSVTSSLRLQIFFDEIRIKSEADIG